VGSGSKGSAATRVLALLVESGVVYIFFGVCFSSLNNKEIVKLRESQIAYTVTNIVPGPVSAFIEEVSSAILVCVFPLNFNANRSQLIALNNLIACRP
jgi:hypothetical protein